MRRITTTDGLSLAVYEDGDPAAPTIVCVHGYPDNHTVWDGVVAELSERFHVVRYDVRGAGQSGVPRDRAAYRLDQLAADLARVLDAVSPEQPAHLLAHDWGAIQCWHAVTGEQEDRIASYTSISGPCLDHAGKWMRSRLRPDPRSLRELATQLAQSWYIAFFHLKPIPELLWRTRFGQRLLGRVERAGTAASETPVAARRGSGDLVHGLGLYRANMRPRLREPGERHTEAPVQVLAPTGDVFVSPAMQSDIARWVPDLRVRRIPGSHWVPRNRPEVVARATAEFVDHVAGGPETPRLRAARAEPRDEHDRHAGELAVITGAGSGIGRATALALAARGARVIATDLDESAARATADLASARGGEATAHRVDVSDGHAMDDLAERVRAEHGVPDVVVNNAGIAVAGGFLDTDIADWRRIVDVNLWGVIHGCRAFARQMAEHGEGGRIVNVASAAAYLPQRSYSAYASTKSAVLMLSRCLRAELAGDGIGVVAVCPGVVNTPITRSTRFAGTSETEQERRRERFARLYRRRGYTAERAAEAIVRATRRNPELAPVTSEARIGLALSRVSPALLRVAARREVLSR